MAISCEAALCSVHNVMALVSIHFVCQYRCGVAACGRFYHADCMKSQEDMKRGFLW